MGQSSGDDLHLDELRQLILSAFEEARDSGKSDWESMRSAVLKNRLLQLTNREFSETRYGGGSMVAVALRVPGLLELATTQPAVLRLADPSAISAERTRSAETRLSTDHPRWNDVRIRQDLWRAVVTPRVESSYVWDATLGQAREATVLDAPEPFLPTIDANELEDLRQSFREERVDDPDVKERLATWVVDPTQRIPKRIQIEWRNYLKSIAATRIQQWFQLHDVPAPVDLIQYASAGDLPTTTDVVRTRTLKAALQRALQLMSEEELKQVLLPATVLMRYEQER
jgi:hypothetical protein